ncbi:MAG: flagellar basal body rod protein FlgB [Bryobacterales bacterium]|nr:flagellar basal body rod protein FlgB [Bryobacterales bacterium]
MDLLVARQKMVSSNIANLDTPGYRTRDLDFQQHLQAALAGGENPSGRGATAIVEQPVEGLTVKNDGNDVSLEREAHLLAETAMRFQMASMMLERRLSVTKAAIREEVAR